jgi:hypothetical protein
MEEMQKCSGALLGASDASFKDGRATHAWIISSGKVDDIMNPILNISGAGAVHGMPKYLSSARGELQGITAISIILNLLSDYHHKRITTSSICGNIGVINKCTNGHFSSLRHNRGANLCRGNIRSDPR